MKLIKKYAAGNKMNYSFDSNNAQQQKLVKKQYDRNADGLGNNTKSNYNFNPEGLSYENMYKISNEKFKPVENTFGQEQATRLAQSNAKKSVNSANLLVDSGSSIIKSGGIKSGVNTSAVATTALSGIANASAVSNDPNATGEDRMNATSGAISGTIGAINPVIGAGIAVGNMIGKKVKDNAEARNPDGTLKNVKKAKNAAYAGAFFSPSKAFAMRQELSRSGDKDAWTTLNMNKYTDYLNKDALAAAEATKKENERIAREKQTYLLRARDQQSSANLYNGSNSGVYKNGGKLIPKFRRGGELDLEKENVILDGPSHDDHNRTGVKGDKGLPVVNRGTKVAEIESLELILNKNSSVQLEKLVNQYKKTGDAKILNKIGEVMKKEINDNTYDYSKELL